MIEFYKKRDFGELLNVTFQFFKIHGKNYFKNYFIINGLLLILLVVIVSFGFREIFTHLVGLNTDGNSFYFEEYFTQNKFVLILTSIIVFILFMLTMLVTYTYPVLYMKRLSETGNSGITADDMVGDIKKKFKKYLVFFAGLIFIIMPIFFILFGISYVLIFLLIGFVLLLFLIPTFVNILNFVLFDYFHTKKGFFSALSYAVSSQFYYSGNNEKTPFWKYWGTTIVVYLIINVVVSIFTMIPAMIFLFATFTSPDSGMGSNPNAVFTGGIGIILFVIYAVSILVSIILSNILYVASGFMYYDSRKDLHQKVSLAEISKIGTNGA